MVFVSDPDRGAVPGAETLRALYCLTPAEVKLTPVAGAELVRLVLNA